MVQWDMQTLMVMQRLQTELTGAVEDVAISYDNRLLASAFNRTGPYLWAKEIAEFDELTLSSGRITSLWRIAFSPAAPLLVSGSSNDGTIVLWDVKQKKQMSEPIEAPSIRNYRYYIQP